MSKSEARLSRDLKILSALDQGWSLRAVASAFGVHHSTVLRVKAKRLRKKNAPLQNSQVTKRHRQAS